MTLQGDMFFAITSAASVFCLVIAAALIWAQGKELKRKEAVISDQQAHINTLDAELFLASKNDARDPKSGRYVRA